MPVPARGASCSAARSAARAAPKRPRMTPRRMTWSTALSSTRGRDMLAGASVSTPGATSSGTCGARLKRSCPAIMRLSPSGACHSSASGSRSFSAASCAASAAKSATSASQPAASPSSSASSSGGSIAASSSANERVIASPDAIAPRMSGSSGTQRWRPGRRRRIASTTASAMCASMRASAPGGASPRSTNARPAASTLARARRIAAKRTVPPRPAARSCACSACATQSAGRMWPSRCDDTKT